MTAAIAVGLVGWSGEARLLPAAILFPALWAMAPTRLSAGLVATGYFLAASRGLPQGVANFYGSGFGAGIALWGAASMLFVAAHTLAWTARPGWARMFRYGIAALVLAVPPIGIVGWAHPITAAGILFPRWGWAGLAATSLILLAMTSRLRGISATLAAAAWVWSAMSWAVPGPPNGWTAIDTNFGGSNGQYAGYQQHRETIDRVLAAERAGTTVTVLPETAFGLWTPTIARLWTRALQGQSVTVYGGAVIVDEAGYDSVMLELAGQGAAVRYRQRMPVPVSMWQPWLSVVGKPAGARADVFANPVVTVAGRRVATLVCYEQLLIWPVLQSALGSPDLLVAPANGWWTSGTDIVPIQIAATTAWARLFGLPLIFAINT